MSCDFNDMLRRSRAGDGPRWRWQRVQDLVTRKDHPDQLDDAPTIDCWGYSLRPADAPPALGEAHHIFVQDGPCRWEIEARLLAGCTPEQISPRIGRAVQVVRVYSLVFFDVTGRSDARDWIGIHVHGLGPWPVDHLTEGDLWRYVGFHGGEVPVDLFVRDYLGKASPEQHRLAQSMRTMAQFLSLSPSPTRKYQRLWKQARELVCARDLYPVELQKLLIHFNILKLASKGVPKRRSKARRRASIRPTDFGPPRKSPPVSNSPGKDQPRTGPMSVEQKTHGPSRSTDDRECQLNR